MPRIPSKTMIAFSYSHRGLISSPISVLLISEYCSRGDLATIYLSRSGISERMFKIRYVLPEKLGPTKSVRLLLLMLTLSTFGC